MARREPDLLGEIERGALDDSVPLATVLRKCVALGGATRNAELRDWASRELNGYRDEPVPDHRVVYAPLLVDGWNARFLVKGQQISSFHLPEFAREHITEEVKFSRGVGELEALLRDAERDGETVVRLQPHMAADLVSLMNAQQGGGIERLYWAVSTGSLAGILDKVRTMLVQLVSEIRSTMGAGTAVPTPEDTAHAVSVVLNGGERHHVTVTTVAASPNTTVEASPSGEDARWSRTGVVWTVIGALVGVVGIVVAIVVAG